MCATPSPSASTARLRNIIEAIPEDAWTPIPYWMDGATDVAETTYVPFQDEPDAVPARLIVRRVQPTLGSQLGAVRQLQLSRLHHRPGTGKPWNWRPTIAATPRSRTPFATSSTASGSTISPSGRFAANGVWLAVQVMAHNLARWTTRIGLDEQLVTTKTLRRRFCSIAGTAHPLGAPPHFASAKALAPGNPVQWRPGTVARPATPSLTAPRLPLTRHPAH